MVNESLHTTLYSLRLTPLRVSRAPFSFTRSDASSGDRHSHDASCRDRHTHFALTPPSETGIATTPHLETGSHDASFRDRHTHSGVSEGDQPSASTPPSSPRQSSSLSLSLSLLALSLFLSLSLACATPLRPSAAPLGFIGRHTHHFGSTCLGAGGRHTHHSGSTCLGAGGRHTSIIQAVLTSALVAATLISLGRSGPVFGCEASCHVSLTSTSAGSWTPGYPDASAPSHLDFLMPHSHRNVENHLHLSVLVRYARIPCCTPLGTSHACTLDHVSSCCV